MGGKGYFNAKGVSIPVAVSVFPDELYPAPAELGTAGASQTDPLQQARQRWSLRGMEKQQLLSEEVRAGFRSLR